MNVSDLWQNLNLKLFSLGAAVSLFLFVTRGNSTPVEVDFRVDYRTPEDVMLVNTPPSVVHTTLQGPWAAFRAFDTSALEPVVVDLTKAGLGTVRYTVGTNEIHAPAGMRVVAARPSELEVVLDRHSERLVPIHADIPDGPAFGFELRETSVEPQKARVTGPVSKLRSLEYVVTEPIDVSGKESDLALDVEVRGPPAPLRLLDRRARVFITIGEETVQRTFASVPVHLVGAPAKTRTSPEAVRITLRGPRRLLEALDSKELQAQVDVTEEAQGHHLKIEKTAQLSSPLPERCQLIGQLPRVTILFESGRTPKGGKK